MTTNGTALAIRPATAPLASRALEPDSIGSAYDLCKILAASRVLPRALSTPEAAFAVVMAGRELGLTAMQSLRSLYFFDGKLTMSADLMVALCRKATDICASIVLVENTDEKCSYDLQRVGDAKPTRFTYTFKDAEKAKLTAKDNWKHHPRAMLRARCAAEAVRAMFPDLLLAVYDTEELAPNEPVRVPPMQVEEYNEDTGEVVDAVDIGAEFRALIAEATTLDGLAAVAAIAKGRGLKGDVRAAVAAMFTEKRAALTAAAEPVAAE
jgi:hypothetical protein